MVTPSTYGFFSTSSAKILRSYALPDSRHVVFSKVLQTLQAHVNGQLFSTSAIHVHINNSPLMTKMLGYAQLDWQLAVIQRITRLSWVGEALHITHLRNWDWFVREEVGSPSAFMSIPF